ncbi:glycerophosphodiester phosphodiesterase domain-containing protein 5-like [Tubulanus polymorphus]|uniref:glycerophosphodiester phosphodiesterase domain-containing protein 5-like n=1 Tax=Tubulanus polymorphus TaxID=672921 RepID=UPI003DA6678A
MAYRRSSIRRIQYYHQNYCSLCITGCFGCRWKRYKQSKMPNSKCDRTWFVLLLLLTIFVGMSLYFWLVVYNDFDSVNWYIFEIVLSWFNWYAVIFGITAAIFIYFILLTIFALCHVTFQYQLFMHYLHRVLLVLFAAVALAAISVISHIAVYEWTLFTLSIHITGPFIQIGAVCLMTLLSWLMAGQWLRIRTKGLKIFWSVAFIVWMLFLYLSPLLVSSPCVCQSSHLPAKPQIIGHRGNAAFAPENTLASFESAVQHGAVALESDVRVSSDGVAFMLHDDKLLRTTNVQKIFPDRVNELAVRFNISDLLKLDAGSFFLQKDPYGTVGSLTNEQIVDYKKQEIPTLLRYLKYANRTKKSVMFDIKSGYKDELHPFYGLHANITAETIKKSGIPLEKVLWLEDSGDVGALQLTGVKKVIEGRKGVRYILNSNAKYVNSKYSDLTLDDIRELRRNNITVIMYVIDSVWLYSLYWCSGVSMVITNRVTTLSDMNAPLWRMSPTTYLIIWIIVDSISLIAIVLIFIAQRFKLLPVLRSPVGGGGRGGRRAALPRRVIPLRDRRNDRQIKQKLVI